MKDMNNKNKVLLISHDFSLTGAPEALKNLALTLRAKGFVPIVASPADGPQKEILSKLNIKTFVNPSIYRDNYVVENINKFAFVVVNTIVGAPLIKRLKGLNVPVVWWVHEAKAVYSDVQLQYMPLELQNNIYVYCVGDYAKNILTEYRPRYECKQMMYYVPDFSEESILAKDVKFAFPSGKKIFAIIGSKEDRKGQDVLVEAIKLLDEKVRQGSCFLFVGRCLDKNIYDVIEKAQGIFSDSILNIDEIDRASIINLYQHIDCLICASRDDPMPVVITEAMIFSKIVICSENTGYAPIIEKFNAGYVYKNNDAKELAGRITEVFYADGEILQVMAQQGRKIYEHYFSQGAADRSVNSLIANLQCDEHKKSLMEKVVSAKKRCAIYLYYNRRGIFEEYAQEAVQGLATVAERVLVVVNGLLNEEGENYIKENGFELLVRENKGYDFGGYKDGIEHIGYEELKSYDELIILNSSVYGPIKPLPEVFAAMDKKDPACDFWGITMGSDGFPIHIQSYFYVFRDNLLWSEAFKSFWQSVNYFKDRDEAIAGGEIKVTQYFKEKGFSFNSYIEPNFEYYYNHSIEGAMFAYEQGSPFIKISLFQDQATYFRQLVYGFADAPSKIFDKLDAKWQTIILKHLCANGKQSVWSHTLRNVLILDDEQTNHSVDAKEIAAIIYVYFEENLDLILSYVHNLPAGSTIYFVSSKKDILAVYKEKTKNDNSKNYEYRLQPNRGRNEAAYWVTCRDVYDKHKYVCLIHDKKIAHLKPWAIGRGFFVHQLDSLLFSEEYIINLIHSMDKNYNIGMTQPALPLEAEWMDANGIYNPVRDRNWHQEGYMPLIIKELGMRLPLDEEMLFPVGSAFWVKAEALKVMFRKEWKIEDFPEEPVPGDKTILHAMERMYPLIIQEAGYHTFVAMPNSYAKGYYDNSEDRLKEMYRNRKELAGERTVLLKANCELINEKNSLYNEKKELIKERDYIKQNYINITNSLSFKLGRLLTWIPRVIRDFFKGK